MLLIMNFRLVARLLRALRNIRTLPRELRRTDQLKLALFLKSFHFFLFAFLFTKTPERVRGEDDHRPLCPLTYPRLMIIKKYSNAILFYQN